MSCPEISANTGGFGPPFNNMSLPGTAVVERYYKGIVGLATDVPHYLQYNPADIMNERTFLPGARYNVIRDRMDRW